MKSHLEGNYPSSSSIDNSSSTVKKSKDTGSKVSIGSDGKMYIETGSIVTSPDGKQYIKTGNMVVTPDGTIMLP